MTDRYYYEAFGELEAAASQVTSDNDFLYTGEQLDPNSEFYYLRARYMDPNAARFTSRDPAAGIASRPFSLNAHIYGENDPSNRFDPSGRMSTMSALATASAVAGVITALATSPHSPFRSKGSQRGENFVGTLNLSDSEQQSVGDALCACVEERYNPFDQEGMEIVRDISEFGAIPIYKPWMGVPVLGGASRFTNFINAFGFFTLRKTNFRLPFRLAGTVRPYTLVGRGNVVVATGFFAYDMTSIGLCVTDHLFGE
ncbi:RHS repeat-associated core domain-containing protein [Tahibacter soli]|uniref:RHS repeat-associated core domain-containing protein n=1 Tax=Tahibacter soli TaxID=2983605 RepID=A0A9X3YKH5_9GAMM|nr:RHS repeat-associated core domain-containing protein [Tahibacter soli]MDC8014004.1 RHS repeat-associated core domain-containing protein [Tahibacter soli]